MQLRSLNMKTDPKRDELIDFLRGGAMLLVLLHHSGFPLGSVILAFHMPLFFILSGYLLTVSPTGCNRPFKEYFWRKFKRLVIPYFAFEIVNLIIWCVKCVLEHNDLPGFESIVSILTCINNGYMGLYGRLWFLPCMFVADIYVWVVLRFLKDRFSRILSILFFFALSFASDKLVPFRLPFTLDTALFGAAFIMLGFCFGEVIRVLINKGNDVQKSLLALGSLVYLAYLVKHTDVRVYMYVNSYGEFTVSVCAAVLGSTAFLIIGSYMYRVVKKLRPLNAFVLWYGNNSLAVFPVHLTIKMLILWYVPVLKPWYIMFTVMAILSIPVVAFITRCFPFMLGNRYQKRKAC